MDNEKDILNMFKVMSKVTMDKERKQEIKMSVLNSRPVISNKTSFSFLLFTRYAYVPLVIVMLFVGALGIKINNEQNNLKDAIETITTGDVTGESNPVSVMMTPEMGNDVRATGLGSGGGPESQNVLPKTKSKTMPLDDDSQNTGFSAFSDPAPVIETFQYEAEGLLGGYDKNLPIKLKITAENTSKEIQKIIFKDGCKTYFIVDTFDSREGQMCAQIYGEIELKPKEKISWNIEIPIQDMALSFGTHKLTFGIAGQYEQSAEFVVE